MKLWEKKAQFYTIVSQKLEKAKKQGTIIKLYYNTLRIMILISISKACPEKRK